LTKGGFKQRGTWRPKGGYFSFKNGRASFRRRVPAGRRDRRSNKGGSTSENLARSKEIGCKKKASKKKRQKSRTLFGGKGTALRRKSKKNEI